jgi:hypothetical protein
MLYTVRTGDLDTDVTAHTHREALLVALITAKPDAKLGVLAEVTATEGDDTDPRYLPTHQENSF